MLQELGRGGWTGFLLLIAVSISWGPSLTMGQVLLEGSCPPVPVMKGFKPERFLGTWYELERYYSDFQVNTKCNKIDFSYNPDGRIGVLTSAIRERNGMPKLSHGLATFEYASPARMVLSMTPTPGSPIHKEFNYWVLDTDYESYAVIYACEQVCRGGRMSSEQLWILGRTAILPQQVLNRIYDELKVVAVDPKKLLKVDQKQCVNVAVSVRSENDLHPSNGFDRNSARKFLASLTNVLGRSSVRKRFGII